MDAYRLLFPDINGAARGKLVSKEHYDKNDSFGMASLVLVDDVEGNEAPGATDKRWITEEDSNLLLVPDQSSMQELPYNDKITAQVLVDLYSPRNNKPVPVAPRTVLKKVLEWYEQQGIEVKIASELEFYILQPDHRLPEYASQRQKAYADLNALDDYEEVIQEILELTRKIGLTPETINKEDCEGQYEITFGALDPLAMADRTLYFKQLVKEVLKRKGLQASFMAKPLGDACGSGGHVHLSLWRDGKNLFDEKSSVLEQFISGNLRYMRELSAIFAPNPNSYRRWNLWPRAAKTPNWTEEGRKNAAIRVTKHGEFGSHLEHRLSGADRCSYQAFAAILAAGARGIEQEWTYKTTEVNDQTQLELPVTLKESLELFNNGEAAELLGQDYVELFSAVKQNELVSFDKAVTAWELDAYGPQV